MEKTVEHEPLSADEVAEFRILEEELWRPDTRFNRKRMNELFALDFVEFGGSGRIHSREACLDAKPSPINVQLPLPEFTARRLSTNVVQVTYNTRVEIDGIVQQRRRSSIWTRTPQSWVIRFHQGTPYKP